MEIIKKHSKLHKELQLEEYLIPFKELDKIETKEEFIEYCQYFQIDTTFTEQHARKYLDDIKNKEEFLEYIEYFQIDKRYLLEQICECNYLEYLHEYLKDDINHLLKSIHNNLNDKNLKYINEYIEIIELSTSWNRNITTVKPFAKTLKKLYANFYSGINDDGLLEAYNIVELQASNNPKITTVKPFANTLKILHASYGSGINDDGLLEASNLEFLDATDNPKITTIKPFAKTLKKLYAQFNCGIDDKDLEGEINLKELYAFGNDKITKKLNKK